MNHNRTGAAEDAMTKKERKAANKSKKVSNNSNGQFQRPIIETDNVHSSQECRRSS